MSRSRRALVALLLLLAIPLRALAAVAMPCCPMTPAMTTPAMPDDGPRSSMQHAMPDPTAHDPGATPSLPPDDAGHAHHGDASTCFTVAMIVPPTAPSTVRVASSPLRAEPCPTPVAAFLTDAPERPPRLPLSAA